MNDTNDNQKVEEPIAIQFLRPILAGNLTTLNPGTSAGSHDELIKKYFELMQDSPTRQFYSLDYISKCVQYARSIPGGLLRDTPLFISALLFHKIGHVPKDKKSIRRSCEIALSFAAEEDSNRNPISVNLISLVKATRTENICPKRYCNDRDYIVDIINHFYGLSWEEFEKSWGLILQEFRAVGRKPKLFKRYSRLHFKKLLDHIARYSLYRTRHFEEQFGASALENIRRKYESLM